MSIQNEIKNCPICAQPIPNREHAGMYAGALSRRDNKTEICSECGVMEAMQDFAQRLSFVTKGQFTDELVKGVLLSEFASVGNWKDVGIDVGYSENNHPIGFRDCFIEVEQYDMSLSTVERVANAGIFTRLSRHDIVSAVKWTAIADGQIRRAWRDGLRNNEFVFTAEMGNAIMLMAIKMATASGDDGDTRGAELSALHEYEDKRDGKDDIGAWGEDECGCDATHDWVCADHRGQTWTQDGTQRIS